MNIVSTAARIVTKTADTATAAAGAVGGAAVSGVVGGVQGVAAGVRRGLDDGSRSSAAAALTLGAVGAAGLVEWPVLLTVGGAALVIRQLNRHTEPAIPETADDPPPTRKTATRSKRPAAKASPSRRGSR
ncbi:hypothetical protein SAMN04489835_5355 [Mycolicibacterium rutilum]|uniref:Transmembrane protein n=1 Tax=Mycolicibacterium rutilum TaxID=370526 RepID=A0A1H6LW19_MYCRU|nr:hypothetical protein [Mycolicibacterium rutilum]SEH89261.1 hypothetical protein SAMN04489835_5355 [Mycolicibacterium rutilum]